MALNILLYKQINMENIKFAKTVYKNNSRHYIDIFYNGNTMLLQTPVGTIENIGDDFMEVSYDDVFMNYIKELERLFKEKVYKHSAQWFSGKQFTREKIEKSLVSCKEGNTVSIKIKDNMAVFNQFKEKTDTSELKRGQKVVLLVKLKALEFVGNKFTYLLSGEQAKVYTTEELNTYSIVDDQTVIESVSSDDEENVEFECLSNDDFFLCEK